MKYYVRASRLRWGQLAVNLNRRRFLRCIVPIRPNIPPHLGNHAAVPWTHSLAAPLAIRERIDHENDGNKMCEINMCKT